MDQVLDASLDVIHEMKFTKRELTIIFNCLVRQPYSLADAKLVQPIVDMLQPEVAQLSSQDVKPVEVEEPKVVV